MMMKKYLRVVSGILFLSSLLMVNASYAIDEGFEYQKISPPVPTSTTDKVEVVEMFWYGCPHCYHFEPLLQKWLKDKPKNVKFVRVPAVFRKSWEIHAQVYYTEEALGLTEKLHQAFFDAIHKQRKRMNTRQEIRDFFIAHGVKGAVFDKAFDSFIVKSKVLQAIRLSRAYGITGVPSMIVDGKYRTAAKMASINDARGPSHENMLKVVDQLIMKESKNLPSGKK